MADFKVESPAGVRDGSNKTFTLTGPVSQMVSVVLRYLALPEGDAVDGYTLVGLVLTLGSAVQAPAVDDTFVAQYFRGAIYVPPVVVPLVPDTLEQMRRQLRMYCPFVPPALAESWLKKRWRQVCERRAWSFLRAETLLTSPAIVNGGTVTVTSGTDVITGSGTAFDSTMIGRQFKVGATAPVFTIVTVASATSLTLDNVWPLATASGRSYQILQAYYTMPGDFLTFLSVVDVANQWRLHINFFDKRQIDLFDPVRTSSGTPYILAAHRNTAAEIPQFEMWPHPTGWRTYPVFYVKRGAPLSSTTTLPSVITGDILVEGALADLARWPGPEPGKRNPMFNLDLWKTHEAEFKSRLVEQARQDNEIYQTDLDYARYTSWPMAPLSASFAQSHAMSVDDGDFF